MWSDYGQGFGSAQQIWSGQHEHICTHAEPEELGGDRLAGVGGDQSDEVGHHHLGHVVLVDGEVLVLEVDADGAPGVVADARHRHLAAREPRSVSSVHIGHLATQISHAPGDAQDRLGGVVVGLTGVMHCMPDLACQSQRVRNDRASAIGAVHDSGRQSGVCTHLHRRCPGDPLEPFGVGHLGDDHLAATLVRDGGRVRAAAVDQVSDHLQLGKCAAHAVAIHDGNVHGSGHDHRHHRIAAAHLERCDGIELPP